MKNLSILLAVLVALGLVLGGGSCNEDNPASSVESVTNLTITGAPNGTDLNVSWSASPTESSTDGITGYKVYFKGTQITTVLTGVHSATVTPNGVGLVEVSAYRDTLESAKVSVDCTPHTGSVTIYGYSISGQPSGVGWNYSNGSATAYNLVETNKGDINFWFDDNTRFSGGNMFYDCDALGWAPFNPFWIQNGTTYDAMNQAPTTGYGSQIEMAINQAYYVNIEDGTTDNYYMKMKVMGYNATTGACNIDFAFQKVTNFRQLGG